MDIIGLSSTTMI